jgi:hypothetical protein
VRVKKNGEWVSIREFQKKLEFKNPKPPRNMEELKDDIKKWSRVGMSSDPKNTIKKSGLVRHHDFDHTYT